MTSQNIALWALINTQSKGGYSNRKKGRYRKLITITFDWIGIFWWGFQQNNSLKAFYQHPENQEYFKFLYICPLSDLECYVYKRKYFNQNLLKLRYMLSQTDICNISAHSDHGHFCWASRKTSFQCLHLHLGPINGMGPRFAPCCDQYTLRKNVRDSFTIFSTNCFDLQKNFR